MKNKRTITIAAITAAIAIIAAFAIFRDTQIVKAQTQLPPPVHDRISFGMVGIAAGQTMRVSVAYTIMPDDPNLPPGPSRVAISFRMINGNLARDARTGEVIRRVVDLERGDATFLDIDYGDLPPGPTRAQLRAVVVVVPPPVPDTPPPVNDRIAATVEVINNANGRTQFAIAGLPAVQAIPQPE